MATQKIENKTYQNFRGKNLDGIDCTGFNLTGCNFRGSSLRGVNFSNCNLQSANFKDADLTGAIFNEGTLTNGSAWLVRIPKTSNVRSTRLNNLRTAVGPVGLDLIDDSEHKEETDIEDDYQLFLQFRNSPEFEAFKESLL